MPFSPLSKRSNYRLATHRDGPRFSKAMHHRPLCKKYSIMFTIELGRSGREQTVDKMSISILKSVQIDV